MSTAIYNNSNIPMEDHSHSLPSLSQIIPIGQDQRTVMRDQRMFHQSQSSSDIFSQKDLSHASTANSTPVNGDFHKLQYDYETSANHLSASNKSITEKCTCKSNSNRVPRPRNAFILFRQKNHQSVLEEGNVIRTNPDVSRELGKRWRSLSPEEKEHWNKLAEEEKVAHAKKYPGYKYTPRRNGKNRSCPTCKQRALRQQQSQQLQMQKGIFNQIQSIPTSGPMLQHLSQGTVSSQGLQSNVPQILLNRYTSVPGSQDLSTPQMYQQQMQPHVMPQQISQYPIHQFQQERLSPLSAAPQLNFAGIYSPDVFPVNGAQVITLDSLNPGHLVNSQAPLNFEFSGLH